MANGFAGSRDLLERRRRRLAPLGGGGERTSVVRRRIDPPHRNSPADDETPPAPLPLKKGVQSIIPRDAWKCWALVSAGLVTWLSLLGIGVWADEAGAAWRNLLGLETGRPIRWFGTCCLLGAAQLSFLVLWHRSRSRKDFYGRYRLWYWVGLTWLAFCVCQATSLHLSAARWATEHYELNLWNSETVVWMLAAAPITMALIRLLRREMHLCRSSTTLLRIAAGSASVSAVTTLMWPLLPQSAITNVVAHGSTALWQLLLTSATLMHTRFVIHITNEVAPRMRPAGTSRLVVLAEKVFYGSLRGLLFVPTAILSRLPVPRFLSRKKTAEPTAEAKPAKRTRKKGGETAETESTASTPARSLVSAMAHRVLAIVSPRSLLGGLGRLTAGWSAWQAARAERNAVRAAERAVQREQQRLEADAKAEAKRVEREARQAADAEARTARDAEKARLKQEKDAAAAQAKADRDAAQVKARAEKEAAQARQAEEKQARQAADQAERARVAAEKEERARQAREAAAKEKEAKEAQARAQREQAAAEARVKAEREQQAKAEKERRAQAEKEAQAKAAREAAERERQNAERERQAAEAREKAEAEAARKKEQASRKEAQLVAVARAVNAASGGGNRQEADADGSAGDRRGKNQARGSAQPPFKGSHVSFDEGDYDGEEGEDDSQLSRKERKKLKKQKNRQQFDME